MSRGKDEIDEKIARARRELHFMRKRWKHVLHHDPFYNPNLSYERAEFSFSHAPAIPTPVVPTKAGPNAADVELGRDQKLHLVVGVLAGERLIEVIVDPDTGKVVKTLDDEADEDEDGDEEGDEDDDDDDGDGGSDGEDEDEDEDD